jgi:hypothetical protein
MNTLHAIVLLGVLALLPAAAAASTVPSSTATHVDCYGQTNNGKPQNAVCVESLDCIVVYLAGNPQAILGCR